MAYKHGMGGAERMMRVEKKPTSPWVYLNEMSCTEFSSYVQHLCRKSNSVYGMINSAGVWELSPEPKPANAANESQGSWRERSRSVDASFGTNGASGTLNRSDVSACWNGGVFFCSKSSYVTKIKAGSDIQYSRCRGERPLLLVAEARWRHVTHELQTLLQPRGLCMSDMNTILQNKNIHTNSFFYRFYITMKCSFFFCFSP